jgi:hypothetical protein
MLCRTLTTGGAEDDLLYRLEIGMLHGSLGEHLLRPDLGRAFGSEWPAKGTSRREALDGGMHEAHTLSLPLLRLKPRAGGCCSHPGRVPCGLPSCSCFFSCRRQARKRGCTKKSQESWLVSTDGLRGSVSADLNGTGRHRRGGGRRTTAASVHACACAVCPQ